MGFQAGDSVIATGGKTPDGDLRGETGIISSVDINDEKALVCFDRGVYQRTNLSGHLGFGQHWWCKIKNLKLFPCNHMFVCSRCGYTFGKKIDR